MKINLKELNEQAITKTTNSKKMRLSDSAANMVFQLFTKNVYSNPIGTVVREITSNCFDSHVEAKVDAPVIIRKTIDKETGSQYISFIDYGYGMSPDRIANIYMVYFESSKRADNTQIGGYGIGAKSVLAYKRSTGLGEQEYDNSFNVITVFDNIKYYYLVYEGEDSPEVSLLHSEIVDEHNGTEVRIPVLANDMYKFEKEMVRQLYYFENVIFEGFEDEDGESSMKNDYQIIRGKNFLFRGGEYQDYMHICLGRVAYPIDYNVLGLHGSDYRLPVALKLEVGDINVTVSRESIDYSEATIKMLKKKLEVAKTEIIELLAKQYDNVRTLEDYFNVKQDFGRLNLPNGGNIYLGNMISKEDVNFANFKYKHIVKMPNDKKLFSFFFEAKMYGKKPSAGRRRRYSDAPVYFEGGYETLLKNAPNVLYVNDEFNRKLIKQAYLREEYGNFFVISKNEVELSAKHDIADLFNHALDSLTDDKGEYLPFVKSLFEMQDEYFEIIQKHCVDYDGVEVPDDFVISRKRDAITKEMRNTTIPVRLLGSYGSSYSQRIKLDALFKFKEPIYYGTKEQEYTLQKASRIFSALFDGSTITSSYDSYYHAFNYNNNNKKKIMFIQVAQNNVKYMEFCKNARPISTIYNTMLYRKADAVQKYFQTHEMIQKYKGVNSLYKLDGFYKISQKWYTKAKEVREFFEGLTYNSSSNLGNMKWELQIYFKTDAVKLSAEQQKIITLMEELEQLEKQNVEVMKYIQFPYAMTTVPQELIDILKKVMVF
jgi:hypothetical protein